MYQHTFILISHERKIVVSNEPIKPGDRYVDIHEPSLAIHKASQDPALREGMITESCRKLVAGTLNSDYPKIDLNGFENPVGLPDIRQEIENYRKRSSDFGEGYENGFQRALTLVFARQWTKSQIEAEAEAYSQECAGYGDNEDDGNPFEQYEDSSAIASHFEAGFRAGYNAAIPTGYKPRFTNVQVKLSTVAGIGICQIVGIGLNQGGPITADKVLAALTEIAHKNMSVIYRISKNLLGNGEVSLLVPIIPTAPESHRISIAMSRDVFIQSHPDGIALLSTLLDPNGTMFRDMEFMEVVVGKNITINII